MIVAGKAPPEREELEEANQRGFDCVELLVRKEHLDDLDELVEIVEDSDVDAVSVHTPHVTLDEAEYFRRADELALRLDAFLVFHSQFMHHVHIPEMEELELESPMGYENNPGSSMRVLESTILEPGHDLVLDTAHLYIAEENYLSHVERLLDDHPDQVPLIHLSDSTRTEDGLGFGKGEMDMERLCRMIDSSFDGILVLEVMPWDQQDALERWNEYTD